MTSKSLFYKLIKEDLKRRIWTIALSILVFFLAYPVVCAMYLDNYKSIYNTNVQIQERLLNFFGPEYFLSLVITATAAVICGLSSFFYLHSRKKVDLYHSIPVKRETLFKANFVSGILIYSIPYITSMLVCLLILGINGQMSIKILHTALASLMIHNVFYLLLYTLVVMTVMLSGNFVVNLLGTLVFYFYGTTLIMLRDMYFSEFFASYYYRGNELGILKYISPLNNYVNILNQYDGTYKSILYTLMKVLIVSLLLIAYTLFLYKRRPSEAAHKAMAFQVSKPIIKFLLVIPISLMGGIFFRNVSRQDATNWYVFGLIFFLLLSYAIIEIIYNFDIKKAFRGKLHLLLSFVTVVMIAIIFHFDLIGYDAYVPDKDKVSTMSIRIEGLDDRTIFLSHTDSYSSYNNHLTEFFIDNMELEDIDAVYELAKLGSEEKDFSNISNDMEMITYDIKYTLNNGREIYRTYQSKKEDCYEFIKEIFENPAYKEAHFPIMQWDSSVITGITLQGVYDFKQITLSEQQTSKLLEVYTNELRTLSLEELSNVEPLATITFEIANMRNMDYYIYPSFTNTIEFLLEVGFDSRKTLRSEDIKSILVYDYSRDFEEANSVEIIGEKPFLVDREISYSKDMDVKSIEYTKREEIEKLLPNLISHDNYFNNRSVIFCDRSYEVIITYYTDEFNNTNNKSYYYKSNEVPDFIYSDFELLKTK